MGFAIHDFLILEIWLCFLFLLLLYPNYVVMCKFGRICAVSLSYFPVFRKRYTFVLRSLHVRVALVSRTCSTRYTNV